MSDQSNFQERYQYGYGQPPKRRLMANFFGHGRESVIGVLIALFVAVVVGFVLKDALLANTKDKTGIRISQVQRWNERTLVFPIEGTDSSGRRALFDVVVLTKNYGWVHGSTDELERDGYRLNAQDINNEVLAPQLRQGLGSARQLIAVGLASREGDVEREIQRAGQRASRIAGWLKQSIGNELPIWTLNLGQYVDPCIECETEDTSWQRPFIVIAVRQVDRGTNIAEALATALAETSNLPSPDRYSTYALSRYRG